MICDTCKLGGDLNSANQLFRAQDAHNECKGDCTCLHKTGAGWYVKANAKAPLMQVQSP
jgi:hypothetical protein